MTKLELIDILNTNFLDSSGRITQRKYKKYIENNKEIVDIIYKYSDFLDDDFDLNSRIHHILYDYKQKRCVVCEQKIKFSYKYNTKQYCSKRCVSVFRNSNKESIEKTKKTNLERYGVDNPFKNETVKDKIKSSRKLIQDDINKKVSKTMLERYGTGSASSLHLKNRDDINKTYWLNNFISDNGFDILKVSEYHNMSISGINQYKNKFKISTPNNTKRNIPEMELSSIVNGVYNSRKIINPYELDLYSEGHKLAIEYNGLYWHSFKDMNYHRMKTELCEEKNIQLLHIFENEWLDHIKKKIWKSMIENKIGLNSIIRIHARKCNIKEISAGESKDFLDENHLQGNGMAKIRIGLFYDNELMSVMTFGKSRFNKNIEYELIRFASKLNHRIPGGASKLLKYFERKYKPNSLISYANRRWSTNIESQSSVYDKLGFKFKNNTKPNYFYFKPGEMILYSRNKFQKHKLKKLLNTYDSTKTEKQNMYDNKYLRISDSGNKVYIKEYND